MNKQNVSWKLVPVEPTEEMLKAMDECSTKGYDERLYAGHAASVYMAAVDAAPASPQQCYCGDITRLGVVHRADSFCDEKPEQEPVAYGMWDSMIGCGGRMMYVRLGKGQDGCTVPLYTHPPVPTAQPKEPEQEPVAWKLVPVKPTREIEDAIGNARNLKASEIWEDALTAVSAPPQRKPLTRGQIREIEVDVSLNPSFDYITPAEQLCRAIEAAHGIKE